MWGHGTMTDGRVAVSHLGDALGIPIKANYAFGSAGGAQVVGSVCDSELVDPGQRGSYAKEKSSDRMVPAALDQVANYSGSPLADQGIEKTLHFFWTGNNDVIASLGWLGRFTICTDGLCKDGQQDFVSKEVACMTKGVETLLKQGARHILVPNVYPRHLSPWTTCWISQEQGLIDNYGAVIDNLNNELRKAVHDINKSSPGANVMYYDANGFMKKAMKDQKLSGLASDGYIDTCVDGCDQCPKPGNPTGKKNWDLYAENYQAHKPDYFYWMTEVVASATVHRAIAKDMNSFLSEHKY